MALIAVASVKGSPGVTTAALALAARWPGTTGPAVAETSAASAAARGGWGAVVVEADPAGGDLAARFGLPRSPGLAELASDYRTPVAAMSAMGPAGDAPRAIRFYVHTVAGFRARVVLGPSPSQMGPALALLRSSGVLSFITEHQDLIVDVGRLDTFSAALPLACSADLLLVVTRAWPDGVDAVASRRDWLLGLPEMRARVELVLTGDLPYRPAEIAEAAGLPVAGHLPRDRRAAAVLCGQARAGRDWTRLPLLRAARSLAEYLTSPEPSAGRRPALMAGERRR